MNKRLLLILILLPIIVFFVYAITLTKDATEKVVVQTAISGQVCLWDSTNNRCLQSNEQVIFGRAEVYPIDQSKPHSMILFVFRDKIYRSTSIGNTYKYNCKETSEEVTNTTSGDTKTTDTQALIEKKSQITGSAIEEQCSIVGIEQQEGSLSLVLDTGTEILDNSKYVVKYQIAPNGSRIEAKKAVLLEKLDQVNDIELKFNQEIYKLQKIDNILLEEIVWIPK